MDSYVSLYLDTGLDSEGLRQFGGSALTSDIEVPKDRSVAEMGDVIPVSYTSRQRRHFSIFRPSLGTQS
jgi:hypothetical protein